AESAHLDSPAFACFGAHPAQLFGLTSAARTHLIELELQSPALSIARDYGVNLGRIDPGLREFSLDEIRVFANQFNIEHFFSPTILARTSQTPLLATLKAALDGGMRCRWALGSQPP